jgi:hypothetical protein
LPYGFGQARNRSIWDCEMNAPVHYHLGNFPPTNSTGQPCPLARARERRSGGYDGPVASIPNAAILLWPLTTQDAVLSLKIEGTALARQVGDLR